LLVRDSAKFTPERKPELLRELVKVVREKRRLAGKVAGDLLQSDCISTGLTSGTSKVLD